MIKALLIFSLIVFAGRCFAAEAPKTKQNEVSKSEPVVLDKVDTSSPEKIDLKPLEDQYWAAKDKDFAVIQNRNYTKDHRIFTSLDYGTLINDPYSTGKLVSFSLGYYFNEHFGIQYSRDQSWETDNSATGAFYTQYNVKPNYNRMLDYSALSVVWVPLYAKMSAMDKAIWYFDLQFAAGLGLKTYQCQIDPSEGQNLNQSALGANLDVTSHVFFSRNLAVRVELRNTFVNENMQRYHLSGSGYSNRDMGSSMINDTTFTLGLTYFFPSFGK